MMQWQTVSRFFLKPGTILFIYAALGLITAIQLAAVGTHAFKMPSKHQYKQDIMSDTAVLKQFEGQRYSAYNNYTVFKRSYFHLSEGKNLYTIYPKEQWDIYKYSPSFAVLMGPLASLPDLPGLILWNLLNALALLMAIRMLPIKQERQSLILLFVIVELLINLQNAQSNALLAGLMIAGYGCMERKKGVWAALWLVLASYVKIYGAVGFCLFLFYPDKLKFIAYSALWAVLFFILPLLASPYHTLLWQYGNWLQLMAADQSASYGLSVMGWLHAWFGIAEGKNYVMIVGLLLFFLPFLRRDLYRKQSYRLQTLAMMLIWVVIFNHKAESPTYIIAVCGAAIWYFEQKKTIWRSILICMVFVLTCLTESDLYSNHTKEYILEPYVIKVIPCIVLYIVTLGELLLWRAQGTENRNYDNKKIIT